MHYLRHSNYKLGKLLPLGLICSIGMAGLLGSEALADGPTATISIGDIVGNQQINHYSTGTGQFYVPIEIHVDNAAAYTVSFWATRANLSTGVSSAPEIESLATVSGGTSGLSFAQIPENHWGYRYSFDTDVKDDATANYKAMPSTEATAEVVKLAKYKGNDVSSVLPLSSGSETKYLTLSFATVVAEDLPAGQYKNTINVSVIVRPQDLTMFGIENMQDMTSERCAATTKPDISTLGYDDTGEKAGDARYIPRTMLKDTRDDHMYIVEKLADGNCWMTENLALSSGTTEATRRTITSEDSNLMPAGSGPNAAGNGNVTYTGSYKLPISSTSGFSSDSGQFMYNGTETSTVTSDISTHYNTTTHTGGYYSWLTVVAGNKGGATDNGQQATEDICPKGWQLPTGQATTGDFTKLYNKYTNKTNFDQVWHIVNNNSYVGYYNNSALAYSASSTRWWSRTSNSDTSAYVLYEDTSGGIYPSLSTNRLYGFSIRCVAKTE